MIVVKGSAKDKDEDDNEEENEYGVLGSVS